MSLFLSYRAHGSRAWLGAAARGFLRWEAQADGCTRARVSTALASTAHVSTAQLSSCLPRNRPTGLVHQKGSIASQLASKAHRRTGCRTFFSRIITDYIQLPPNYRDAQGLEFSRKQLSQEQVYKIFGKELDAVQANRLLRIMHGRRVAGTLQDPVLAVHTKQYTKEQMDKALAYLRETVYVPEIINAGLRAEDELADIQDIMADKEEQRIQRAKEKAEAGDQEDDAPVITRRKKEDYEEFYKPDPIYGPSKLDEIRARNVARARALQRIKAEKEKQTQAQSEAAQKKEAKAQALVKAQEEKRKITNPKIAKYEKQAQSKLEAPPAMRTWERILPSATVVALVLGFAAAVGAVYEEPGPRYRLIPNVSTANATVGCIVAINALVLLAWRVPQLWRFLNRWMIFIVATPRPVTLFTAIFSHQRLGHMLINMTVLSLIGPRLHDDVGRANFVALYLASGSIGFLGALTVYTLKGMLNVTSMGASAAALGVTAAYFWHHRLDGFKIMELPPGEGVHGIIFLAVMLALHLGSLKSWMRRKLDVVSHRAGMAAGILAMALLELGRRGGGGASTSPARQGGAVASPMQAS
ncbi:hypothetical protein CDD81_3972 [Ophiocordyceps australis]|uniref:Peptidase S54 rhomboid domain-containing protein n=1 Tax=Ophiocordyceps australis TaxID=1399860 RepID=A0A2C5XWA3_9HYPO|nr:hypothetical protein CDD81_3972 [Ophiocordyceps australis]